MRGGTRQKESCTCCREQPDAEHRHGISGVRDERSGKKGCPPRSGETWTSVRVRHGRPSWTVINVFYYSKFCARIAKNPNGAARNSRGFILSNFATCALNKSHFRDLIFVAGVSYTSSCVSQHPSGPRLLQPLDQFLAFCAPCSCPPLSTSSSR